MIDDPDFAIRHHIAQLLADLNRAKKQVETSNPYLVDSIECTIEYLEKIQDKCTS